MKPMINPTKAGNTQPIPIVKNGKNFSPKVITACAKPVFAMNSGLALIPSTNEAIIVKYVVN